MPSRVPVLQSELFSRRVKKAASKFPRINESVRAVTWLLSLSPEEGKILGPPLSDKYRMLNIAPPAEDFPRIWIAYKLDDNAVTLEDIEIFQEPADS